MSGVRKRRSPQEKPGNARKTGFFVVLSAPLSEANCSHDLGAWLITSLVYGQKQVVVSITITAPRNFSSRLGAVNTSHTSLHFGICHKPEATITLD